MSHTDLREQSDLPKPERGTWTRQTSKPENSTRPLPAPGNMTHKGLQELDRIYARKYSPIITMRQDEFDALITQQVTAARESTFADVINLFGRDEEVPPRIIELWQADHTQSTLIKDKEE